MSGNRPTVDPIVVSTAIDGAPARVRRRLDRDPQAASNWTWEQNEDASWQIAAGNETVLLPSGHVESIDRVRCTCLLAPNCFHVMACLTVLEIADGESTQDESEHTTPVETDDASAATDSSEKASDAGHVEMVVATPRQNSAAEDLSAALHRLLRVGIAGAGVSVQSGLMRAVHQCRAAGLHRAAATATRVIEGTRQVRRRTADSDPLALAEDVADALHSLRQIRSGQAIGNYWIGSARRQQFPIKAKRLHGLLAEPILTRSGFGGVAVYVLGDDQQIYSVSDVRPGDDERCHSTYRGGVDIGRIIEPARKISRSSYLGADLTASRDGRLGRGRSVKVAAEGGSDWQQDDIDRRFAASLNDQQDAIYSRASLPPDARPAGWDFLFASGTVRGANGAELLFEVDDGSLLRLGIANESDRLYFRENLLILAHAPGLSLRVIGRLDLQRPDRIAALAIGCRTNVPPDSDDDSTAARLELPEPWGGRVFLGLDELQRHQLANGQPQPVVIPESEISEHSSDPMAALRRRWVALLLSGTSSQHRSLTNTVAAEIGWLDRSGFSTGAALLDRLSRDDPQPLETFLATAVYLQHCESQLARARVSLT